MGQTVDWLSEGPPRQGAPPILRWRSSLAGPTHAYHQGASQKEARRMQNHEVGFRWCCKPPRPACPFRRPPLDSAGLACGPAGLPCVPSEWSDLRLVQRPCEARFLGLEIGASQSTLPVGAERFRRTPPIAPFWSVFGATCLSLQPLASSVGFGDDGASVAREEPAGFRRNLIVYSLLRYSGPVRRK